MCVVLNEDHFNVYVSQQDHFNVYVSQQDHFNVYVSQRSQIQFEDEDHAAYISFR